MPKRQTRVGWRKNTASSLAGSRKRARDVPTRPTAAPPASGKRAQPRHWLFKSEPGAYGWDDLVRDGRTHWDGVRNYQARNLLRDEVRVGDGVLFYHSNADPMCVMGTCRVVRAAHPDHTAWDPTSETHDPKASPANPIWMMVDLAPDEAFARPVTRKDIQGLPECQGMMLLARGARLSVQPVSKREWNAIVEAGRGD